MRTWPKHPVIYEINTLAETRCGMPDCTSIWGHGNATCSRQVHCERPNREINIAYLMPIDRVPKSPSATERSDHA
jgi:hypothetical protein